MSEAIGIGIVGYGKIARDQHHPAIDANPNFRLLGVASQAPVSHSNLLSFNSLDEMLRAVPNLEAVSICTPPQQRYAVAQQALEHGLHVLLEKPPAASVYEALALAELAARRGVSLFASWHSRHSPAVEAARLWLGDRKIRQIRILWKENVHKWHPGQEWIWQLGGLGVFDPGINALSIITRLLPGRLHVKDATLWYPANRAMPVAAALTLGGVNAPIHAEFDFRHEGEECWDIQMETEGGELLLSAGGGLLSIDGNPFATGAMSEYAGVYERFASLIRRSEIDADLAPLQLVSEAFSISTRMLGPPI